jgi:hypothetical protein
MQRRSFLALAGSVCALRSVGETPANLALRLPAGRSFGDAVNGMAVHTNGNLLVAHTGGIAGVAEFSPDGAWVRDWASEFASQGQDVFATVDAIWAAGHASHDLGGISKYSLDGKLLGTWQASGVTSIAVAKEGHVYATLADGDFHGIAKLDFPNPIAQFGKRGRRESEFRYPKDLVIHEQSPIQLEVFDSSNNRKVWLSSTGQWVKSEPAKAKPRTIRWQNKVWTAQWLPGGLA